ncbi:MAG: hypothetical protein HY981_04330 [Candidatus Magasanikbacteria bacterium]|nr:hypothetical protein [Candidatus Magasanikbacteria bacterium]
MSPERTTQESETQQKLSAFRAEIAEFANEAYDAQLVENTPQHRHYDATVVMLYGKTEALGAEEMKTWNQFKDFVTSITAENFEEKKSGVQFLQANILRARNRYSDGLSMDTSAQIDVSDANRTRHEFYGWLINLEAALELMADSVSYDEYNDETLAEFRKKLKLNG